MSELAAAVTGAGQGDLSNEGGGPARRRRTRGGRRHNKRPAVDDAGASADPVTTLLPPTQTTGAPTRAPPQLRAAGGASAPTGSRSQAAFAPSPIVKQARMRHVAAAGTAHVSKLRFEDIAGVSANTKRALREGFEYEFATDVQAATIQPALSGRDMLARARTGTGKTLGFVLPTIERISEAAKRGPRSAIHAVIVSPTRELASQIAVEAEAVCEFHGDFLGVRLVVGGTNRRTDENALKRGPNSILVCTPGRFHDHAENTPGFKQMLSNTSVAILDECDTLLEMGFRNDILKLLKMLPPVSQRQTLLFSATIPAQFGEIARLALKADHEDVDCVGTAAPETAAKVEQTAAVVHKSEWLPRLAQVISEGTLTPKFKIMVFCTTARTAGFCADFFKTAGVPNVMEIHSRMSQSARTKTSDAFRASAGSVVLFTSDVSARGVDYPGTTLVVQLGLPSSRETYVHRLGRTARAGLAGKGMLLLCDYERPFLQKHVSDLPIKMIDLGQLPAPREVAWAQSVDAALGEVARRDGLSTSAERAYGAWLGYMKGHLKLLRWTPEELVQEANEFALQLGLVEPPALPKKTVGKMGLKGVRGLRVA